jgi:uncharacterized protein (UPF0332 family)
MSGVEDLLDRAGRSFDAAQLLLSGGYADFAVSQTYYGIFYVAEALLLYKGFEFSRHGQVVGGYGREFAKTGELDPRYHRLLIETFDYRQATTYGPVSEEITAEEVEEYVREGRAFVADARSYLR